MNDPKPCLCGNKYIIGHCDPDMEAASSATVVDMRRNFLDCADPPGMKCYNCPHCLRQGAWKPTMAEALAAWDLMISTAEKEDRTMAEEKAQCVTCDGFGWIYDPTKAGLGRTRGWGSFRPCHDLACPVQGGRKSRINDMPGDKPKEKS